MKVNRVFLPGMLLLVLGVSAATISIRYGLGSLNRMQTGYFPFAVSILLIIGASGLLLEALYERRRAAPEESAEEGFDFRSIAVVAAAILSFAFLVPQFGLMPATAVLIVISVMAQPGRRFLEIIALVIGLTLLVYFVFNVGLRVSVPAITWWR